jgi:hypothetical protein
MNNMEVLHENDVGHFVRNFMKPTQDPFHYKFQLQVNDGRVV